MSATAAEQEGGRIARIAREYVRKGYEVVAHPKGTQLPRKLRGFAVDLVARSEDDKVIVEVSSRTDSRRLERLKEVADLIGTIK